MMYADLKIVKSVTERIVESLSRYLSDIGQINMINAREEVLLARKIRETGELRKYA